MRRLIFALGFVAVCAGIFCLSQSDVRAVDLHVGTGRALLAAKSIVYTGLVATRLRVPTAFVGTGVATSYNSRTCHVAQTNITQLGIGIAQWYTNTSTFADTNIGGTGTYTAAVEYPVGVTYKSFTFSGSTTTTAADGVTLLSDLIAVSIPKGATFATRVFGKTLNGLVFSSWSAPGSCGDATQYSTSTLTDLTLGGAIPNTGGTNHLFPLLLFGPTTQPSAAAFGDSLLQGLGTASSPNTATPIYVGTVEPGL
jgi:hypothetical protein